MPVRATYLHDQPPAFGQGLRLAIFQGEGPAATRDAIEQNLETLESAATLAQSYGAQLLALPELFLSGYIVYPEVVAELAEPMNGPSLQRVGAIAQAHQLAIVCPYAEVAEVGGQHAFYDAIALFGSEGSLLKNYRKTHLWGPDEKRIWTQGSVCQRRGRLSRCMRSTALGLGS
jgi:5-aminopentanamidase